MRCHYNGRVGNLSDTEATITVLQKRLEKLESEKLELVKVRRE